MDTHQHSGEGRLSCSLRTHRGRGQHRPPLRDVSHVGVVGIPEQRTSSLGRCVRLPAPSSRFPFDLPL